MKAGDVFIRYVDANNIDYATILEVIDERVIFSVKYSHHHVNPRVNWYKTSFVDEWTTATELIKALL